VTRGRQEHRRALGISGAKASVTVPGAHRLDRQRHRELAGGSLHQHHRREQTFRPHVKNVDTIYTPDKIRIDETPAHVAMGATWQISYTEVTTDSANVMTTIAKDETWTVEATAESVTVPAGTFTAMRLHKVTSGAADKMFWFAAGVGKIKETGDQTEELVSYTLPCRRAPASRSKMRSLIVIALSVAAAHPALADDTIADADAAALAAARKQKKKAKDEAKRKQGDTLEVHGRVFARGAAAKEETALGAGAWTSELTLASARIGVDYQWREQLRAKLSYEAAKSSVRYAYVELDHDHGLRLRAGRMKLPVGAIEQTSSWTLPTIGRGMVADVVADGLGATGRRSAMELRWKSKGPARPSVTLAVAQGVRTAGGQQPGLVDEGGGLTVAARVGVEPCRATASPRSARRASSTTAATSRATGTPGSSSRST
jgi:hypothetical protein